MGPALKRHIRLVILYALQSARALWPPSSPSLWGALVRDFPAWRRSQASAGGALDDESPWMPFAAIRYLARTVRSDARVFEYGSGGSTLFFARRAGQVISIEHDPAWCQRVTAALQARQLSNCQLRLVEPTPAGPAAAADPADPAAYVSFDAEWRGLVFRDYAAAIDAYPDGYFDVVVVDGRARPACFAHGLPKVKPGGTILWDNSGRSYYQPAMTLAAGFRRRRFFGPVPYLLDFDETTFFQKP